MRLNSYCARKLCVGLATIACLLGCGISALADEVYVHNKSFKRVVYVESNLYAPLGQFMKAMRVGASVSQDGRLLLNDEFNEFNVAELEKNLTSQESAWTDPNTKFFEAEYGGVVFPIAYIQRDNEIWVPVRQIAERLGFTVKDNKATGIIDIIAPRAINSADRAAAEDLKAEKAAQIERTEQILAARRAEKLKRQKEEAEQAKKAAAQKKKAAQAAASNNTNTVRRKRVTYSAEGDFPSEFNNDEALSGVSPRRISRSSSSAQRVEPQSKSAEASYPKAKPRPKKKTADKTAKPAPKSSEIQPSAQVEKKKETSVKPKSPEVLPFVSYTNPQVSANYGDGSIEYSVSIFNRSAVEAKKVSAVLYVTDSSGKKIITKREELGTMPSGTTRVIKGSGRHPLRGSIPRTSYYLEVELNWEGRRL